MGRSKLISKAILFTALVALWVAPVVVRAETTAAPLKITELAVTTKIAKGNPIDSVRRISSASVKALYCFTRLTSTEEAETTIKHVWYRDDEKVG